MGGGNESGKDNEITMVLEGTHELTNNNNNRIDD